MPRRLIKPVSALLTGSFAVLSLGLVLLGWRLSQGPIALTGAETYIAAALNQQRDDLSIALDEVVIAWNPKALSLDVQLHNVVVTDQEGEAISIPQANVGLSGRALLNGMIAPLRVSVSDIAVTLVIYDDGRFALTGSAPGTTAATAPTLPVPAEERQPLSPVLLALLSPPDRSSPIGFLEEFELRNSLLLVENRQTGSNWALNSSQIVVNRDDDGAHSLAVGEVSRLSFAGIAGTPTPIAWSSRFDRDSGRLGLTLSFDNLSLGDLVAQFTGIDFLSGSDAPVTGRMTGSLLLDPETGARFTEQEEGISFAFDLGAGQILAGGGLFEAPFDIYEGRLAGTISPDFKTLSVDQLLLSRDPFVIEGTAAAISRSEDEVGSLANPAEWEVNAALSLEGLSVQQLRQLWPARDTDGARKWVAANMEEGQISNGRFRLAIPAGFFGSGAPLPKEALDLTFDLNGGVAHVFRPLPPLTNAIGRGHLTARSFTMSGIAGDIDNLSMTQGSFAINDFSVKGGPAEIALTLSGDLAPMMHFLNKDPFGYPGKAGLDPDDFSGKAIANAMISVPLTKSVSFSDVSLDIKGEVREATLPSFVNGMVFTDAAIDIAVTETGLKATGPLKVNDVPVRATWTEKFNEDQESGGGTHIFVMGDTDEDARARLGYDLMPYVKGSVPLVADIRLVRGEGVRLLLDGDFLNATVDAPLINWQKSPGNSLRGSVALFIPNDGDGFFVERAEFSGDGASLKGNAQFGAGTDPEELNITELKAGTTTDLSIITVKEPDGSGTLKIEAAKLDLAKDWLSEGLELFRSEKIAEAEAADGEAGSDKEPAIRQFDWWIAQLYHDGAPILDAVAGRFTPKSAEDGTQAYAGTLTARMASNSEPEPGSPLIVSLKALPKNAQYIHAETKDGGALLRLLGLVDQAREGDLLLEGVIPDFASTDEGEGRLRVKGVRIVKLPVLAQLINVSSMAGLGNALQGEGLVFDDITVPFTVVNGQVRFKDGRAIGPSVGIKARGVIGFDGAMDVDGTIAPAYTLNAAIGKIPVIGELLVGGEGEGLFAANFAIDSNGDGKPAKITVNPLSALTPGFLRGIFGDTNPATNPDAEKKKTLPEKMPELQPDELPAPGKPAPPAPPQPSAPGE